MAPNVKQQSSKTLKVGVFGKNLSLFGKRIYVTKSPISFFFFSVINRLLCRFPSWKFLGLRKNVNFIETFGYETFHISGRYRECFGVFIYRSVNFRMSFWCFKFSKKNEKIWWISALESTNWWNSQCQVLPN